MQIQKAVKQAFLSSLDPYYLCHIVGILVWLDNGRWSFLF